MRDHRQREDNGGEYCNRLDVRDFSVHGDGAAERDTFDIVLSCTGCRSLQELHTLCERACSPAVRRPGRRLLAWLYGISLRIRYS